MAFLNGYPIDDQVALLMVQLVIILTLPRILARGLKYVKQPLVVSEILSGIILGPSVLGRIPGFIDNIFPDKSLPWLNTIAQLGLTLFLFMVGLNLDPRKIRVNAKTTLTGSGLGLIIPFAVAVPIGFLCAHPDYTTENVGVIIAFFALCFQISALAVLARILAERKLLETELGVMSLSTAALDTFVAWIFLAIILAFATTSSGKLGFLSPLWTLLIAVAHMLFLYFVVRRGLNRMGEEVKRKGTLTPLVFVLHLLVVFSVAWFTDQLGISAIFGAFEVGLLVPRKGPVARLLKEKLEDLVVSIMLPVFFTYSGLRTQLGLIDTSAAVGITILIIVVAPLSKFTAIMIAARFNKLPWLQSVAFGILMSCKGLVALVMFNIAIDHKIITPRLFAMLVVYSLVATFIVTPAVGFVLNIQEKRTKYQVSGEEAAGYNVLLCPQQPRFAPPQVTFVNSIIAGLKTAEKITVHVLRIFDPSDRMSDIMGNDLKHDVVIAPAVQRSRFFKLKLDVHSTITDEAYHEVANFVKNHSVNLTVIGYDGTDNTKAIIGGMVNRVHTQLAILSGGDIGIINKVLCVFTDQAHDQLAFEFVAGIVKQNHCDVVILNVAKDPNVVAKIDQMSQQFGNVFVTTGDPNSPVDAILNETHANQYSLVVTGYITEDTTLGPKYSADFLHFLDGLSKCKTTVVVVHSPPPKMLLESFVMDTKENMKKDETVDLSDLEMNDVHK